MVRRDKIHKRKTDSYSSSSWSSCISSPTRSQDTGLNTTDVARNPRERSGRGLTCKKAREGFSYRLAVKSDGAITIDIKDDIVKPGQIKIYQLVACEDETSAATSIRLGKQRRQDIIWFNEEKNPVAGTLYWSEVPLYVYQGENLIVRFTGTTSGDILSVYCHGLIKEVK